MAGGAQGMSGLRSYFQKGDMLAIAGVVLLAALVFLVFLPRGDVPAACAEIYQDGKLIKTVCLTDRKSVV